MNTTATSAAGDAPRRRRATSAAGVVQAAALPAPLGEFVLGVTGKCRLWKSERTDVARELCAHFRDGIEAGASPEELAASFGDPGRAARLITATRKRMRPRWWRTSRAMLRAIGAGVLACVLLYAVLAARFFLVSPAVKRNITNELNAVVRKTAPADRAWPLYIEVRKEFGPLPDFMTSPTWNDPAHPGEENWDKLAEWLDAHATALETLRAAAAKPTIGYFYRGSIDPDLARAMEVSNPGYKYDPTTEINPTNPMVVGILLPQLGEMRNNARWLRSDAYLAASRSDRARFLADIDALLGMGRQALDDRFLISELVGISIADITVAILLDDATRADFLTSDDLRTLAHTLAAFGGGGHIPIDTSIDVLMIEDILQRFYSDDGNGDGHFVGGGGELDRLYADWGVAKPKAYPLIRALQPLKSAIMPSRAALRDSAKQFVAAAAADDALPPWRHDERTSDRVYHELMESGLYTVVPFLRSLEAGSDTGPIASACAARDLFQARRDAALAVIAMESFRRAHASWPATLHDLVPAYLPAVPVDPFDGKPLRYAAPTSESQLPLLYSVGIDAIDDSGKPPATEPGRFSVHNLQLLAKFRAGPSGSPADQQQLDAARGDWILWPVPAAAPKPAK